MLRRLINAVGIKLKGPGYLVSEEIPIAILLAFSLRRALCLLRGVVRLRRVVFVENNVRVRNRHYLSLGRSVTLQEGTRIDAFSRLGVALGDRCNIGPHVQIRATSVVTNVGTGLVMGADCGVGAFSFFGCGGGISIGNNVIMGQYVSFHSENHIFDDLGSPIRKQGVTRSGISIGDDCWIGAKVTFLDGARVGSGVVVAAGSVVRGNIPDEVVVGGVPARVLRHRSGVGADLGCK